MTFLLWHSRGESYFIHKSRFIIYKTGALPQRRQHDIRMNIDAYRNEKKPSDNKSRTVTGRLDIIKRRYVST